MPSIAYLECSRCHARLSAETPQTVCLSCADQPACALYVRYDFSHLRGTSPDAVIPHDKSSPWSGMWRYGAVLPDVEPVTLGEGWTPMLRSRRHPGVFLKEEGTNPTGTFKARGLALAVTMARHYGLRKLAIPSAGNAAGALAAYAAAADIEAHIFMPRDVPLANYVEAMAYGANVTLVDGLISDCARMVGELKQAEGWFDISSLKEPFRVEGKKTMGYEVAEQLNWELPDAIFYPTGGGVGLIGMWKAFDEMEQLGWIGKKRPKMVAVQAEGCQPITKAWEEKKPVAEMFQNANTLASGLRVPKPYADYIILDILKKSSGTAISVSDKDIFAGVKEWASTEGLFAAPEGAACLPAYKTLVQQGFLKKTDKVVIFNTGSGLKYLESTAEALGISTHQPASHMSAPATRKIGGIIQPY